MSARNKRAVTNESYLLSWVDFWPSRLTSQLVKAGWLPARAGSGRLCVSGAHLTGLGSRNEAGKCNLCIRLISFRLSPWRTVSAVSGRSYERRAGSLSRSNNRSCCFADCQLTSCCCCCSLDEKVVACILLELHTKLGHSRRPPSSTWWLCGPIVVFHRRLMFAGRWAEASAPLSS